MLLLNLAGRGAEGREPGHPALPLHHRIHGADVVQGAGSVRPAKALSFRPIPPSFLVLARARLWCLGARMWRVNLPWCVKSIPNSCLTPRIAFPSCSPSRPRGVDPARAADGHATWWRDGRFERMELASPDRAAGAAASEHVWGLGFRHVKRLGRL